MAGVLKLLQVSDVHLDSSMHSSALNLPPAKRAIRLRELREVVRRVRELANEEQADCVVVPGDLFDDESVKGDTASLVVDEFGGMRCPVVVTPGNHDFYSPSSIYSSAFLWARFSLQWPPNVHIISSPTWVSLEVPGIEEYAFSGICFTANVPVTQRMLNAGIPMAAGKRNILVFHGSREGFAPSGKAVTLPFTDAELDAVGFDYAAVGHYHSHAVISNGRRVLGAYAGCPAGRGKDECGEKSVLLVSLADHQSPELRRVSLDARQLHSVEVDCTGLSYREAVLDRVSDAIRAVTTRADDLVFVNLVGRASPHLDLSIPDDFLADRYFHVQVDRSALRPDYDVEALRSQPDRTTVEGRFVQRLLAALEDASGAEQRATIEQALYYGLDALRFGKVQPRHVD